MALTELPVNGPICSILLHDPQEIINAIENNRTVILDESSSKIFPVCFTNDDDLTSIQIINAGFPIYFDYNNQVCNYFGRQSSL